MKYNLNISITRNVIDININDKENNLMINRYDI